MASVMSKRGQARGDSKGLDRWTPSSLTLALGACALSTVLSLAAEAQPSDPGQLVLLPVAGDGSGVSDGLHRLVRSELTHSAPQRLIDVPPQSLGDLQREAGCEELDAPCLGQIASFLGCDFAVLLRVGSSQGGRVVVTVELVSDSGEARGRAERVAVGPRADVVLAAAVPDLVDELFGLAPSQDTSSTPGAPPSRRPGPAILSSVARPDPTTTANADTTDSASETSGPEDVGEEEPASETTEVPETLAGSRPRIPDRTGDETSNDFPLVVGGSLLGLGALAGVAGLITGLVAANAEDEWQAAPRDSRAQVDSALASRDRAERWATTTNILLVSAGVLGVAGVAFLIAAAVGGDEAPPAVAVVPTLDGAMAYWNVGEIP